MRLLVKIDGKVGELQFEREGDACRFDFQSSDASSASGTASIFEVEPGIFSVLVGGRSYEAKVVAGGDGYYVDLGGHRSSIEVRDPRTYVRRAAAGAGEGRQNVNAPMPGKVIRVLVTVDQEVEAGAGLVVVEAMKMQNEMKAPRAGRVVQISAREGDTVTAGQTLAVIE